MKFYTSDFHFEHKNILKYENRPFGAVSDMNDYIIENLNKYIKKGDILHILGDMTFASLDKTIDFLKRIRCNNIKLTLGNHDSHLNSKSKKEKLKSFVTITDNICIVKDSGHHLVLCHFPIEEWPSKRRGYIHLHGHSHGNLENKLENRIDVGIDTRKWDGSCLAYTLEELLKDDNYRETINKSNIY